MRVAALLAAAVVLTAAAAPSASAQVPSCRSRPWSLPTVVPGPGPDPLPYGTDDGGGFRDVLPSGTRGHYNAVELGRVPRPPARPSRTAASSSDVRRPRLRDARAGGRPGRPLLQGRDVRRRARGRRAPLLAARRRHDRARQGVRRAAHLRRDARRRDVRRSATRARRTGCSSWTCCATPAAASWRASPAAPNAAMDAEQWAVAPYTEADLQRQADQLDDVLGPDGAMIQRDVEHYIAGINQYISEAKLDPTKMPGEYAAIGRPQGPDPWKATDVIATASLVGGIFGKGGGAELECVRDPPGAARALRQAQARHARLPRLPLGRGSRGARDGARHALPVPGAGAAPARGQPRGARTPGSLRYHGRRRRRRRGGASGSGSLRSAGCWRCRRPPRTRCSCPARESASGHPLMVAGPQTAYFNPQILMEQEVHAPGSEGRPPIDARGASFIGVNLYVQLGRGRDYAWSATSAGQDNIDTFALKLCDDDALPLPRPRASRSRCSRRRSPGRRRSPTRRPPARRRCAPSARSSGSSPRAAPIRGKPVIFTQAALDVLPRGRLRGRLHGLQHADGDHRAGGVPARGEQDRLHVQLVLRRRREDRLLQLGREPGARARRIDHDLPVRAALRVARLGPGRVELRRSRRRERTRR